MQNECCPVMTELPSIVQSSSSSLSVPHGMPKYATNSTRNTGPHHSMRAVDVMLLGEDYQGNQQGAGCVALGLHMSEGDQSDARPRHPANGRLVMDSMVIRCTVPNCSCDCFTPCKPHIRTCDTCKHGWVAHALDKLGFRHMYNCNQVEIVQPNVVFDIASLMLYGCQATPIRLKILLDRLFSVLQHEEVLQVLQGFGWSYEDYARGYILQDSQGTVLDKWTVANRDEEPLILQQFLRFGETKAITQQILLQESTERQEYIVQPGRADSDIKKFIERTNRVANPIFRQNDAFVSGKLGHHHHHHHHHHQQQQQQQQQQRHPQRHQHQQQQQQSSQGLLTKSLLRLPSTGCSSVQNLSPNGSSQSFGSPVNCSSPLSISPLNRLQNMQPYDFRRDRSSPDVRPPATELSSPSIQSRQHESGHHHHKQTPQQPQSQGQQQQQQQPHHQSLPSSGTGPPMPPTNNSPPSGIPTVAPSASIPSLATSIVHSSNSSILANSDLSATDGGSEDDTVGSVLNLSRTANTESIYATKKVKHLRKSANPMKRRWNTNMLSTFVSNQPSGKKRVQCTVCFKTFCDKGALKIHFSAVHLKEMHKCTVEGCNMMFSSRRSRNRHSANPNPKLHSPHLRRKISPHDGRSANANHPAFLINPSMVPPPLGPLKFHGDHHHHHHISSLMPLGPIPLPPPPSGSGHDDSKEHISRMNNQSRSPSPTDETLRLASRSTPSPSETSHHRRQQVVCTDDDVPIELKRPRFSEADDMMDEFSNDGEDNGSNGGPLGKDETFSNNKGVRKRKSLNPTRCAITDEGDIQYVSSDDSSSDTFLHNDSMDNGTEKSDDFKDDDDDDDDDKDILDEDDDLDDDDDDPDLKRSITPLIPVDKIKREKGEPGEGTGADDADGEEEEEDEEEGRKGSTLKEPKKSVGGSRGFEESSETALRHLESLSQGNFGDSSHFSLRAVNLHTSPIPSVLHLPLSLMHGPPGDGFRDTSPRLPDSIMSGSVDLLQQGTTGRSSPESPMSESQPLPGMPSFRDTGLMGCMDVPVDKDNPRRCTACGKIFQNHFGVKTHYQNVHLKLMHKCTVEGCNAAFPSKRSRDRHSANLNLHRKLLSTTEKSFFEKSIAFASLAGNQTLRDEFLSRIYGEAPLLPLNMNDLYQSKLSTSMAESILNNNDRSIHNSNHFGSPHHHHHHQHHHHLAIHSGLLVPTSDTQMDLSVRDKTTPVTPRSLSPPAHMFNSSSHNLVYSLEDDLPSPDANGNFPCKFCHKRFQDGVILKDHYEKIHLPEMFRCTVNGCNKIFSSQKKRNQHSQNSSIHKHLATES